MATQTLARVKTRMDARHLMRYLKFKADVPLADIARSEKVTIKVVQASIREMERYEALNSEGQVSLAVRDLLRVSIEKAKDTLGGLLEATNTVERPNAKTGLKELVSEPDKITRLEALKVMNALITSQQPKVAQTQVNVNQTNQTAVLSSAETTEERMRRLKAQAAQHNLLPPVVAAVPVAIDEGYDPDDDRGDDDEDDD